MTDAQFHAGDRVQLSEQPPLYATVTQIGAMRGSSIPHGYVRVVFDQASCNITRVDGVVDRLVLKSTLRKLSAVELLAELVEPQ